MRCPSCNHENPTDAVFCNQCGSALANVTCAQCATQNRPNSKFCKQCGRLLLATAQAVSAATSGETALPNPSSVAESSQLAPRMAEVATTDQPFPGNIPPEPLDPASHRKTCARCGAINEIASQFCYRCGWNLSTAAVSNMRTGVPAGFWIRFLAALIDVVILAALGFGIGKGFGSDPTPITSDVGAMLRQAFLSPESLASTFVDALYYTILIGAAGGTVGKLVLGLRVVRTDGRKVGFGRAFGRYLATFVSLLCFGLGYLWIAFNKDKRGWHDYLTGTKVIRSS